MERNREKKEKNVMPTRIPWNRLSKEEKEEIKEKARIRREEKQRQENIKETDIILGKQKIQDDAWG